MGGKLVISLLIMFLVPTICGHLAADDNLQGRDDRIDGRKLRSYDLSWNQCVLQEGNWTSSGAFLEVLVPIGEQLLRHRQTNNIPDGSRVTSTSYFDQQSMALLRVEQEMKNPDGTAAAQAEYIFTSEGYTGSKRRDNQSKNVSGSITSNMLHGAALGLPLATLPMQDEPLTFEASMIGMDASYDVSATWAGTEDLQDSAGNTVTAMLVDVKWKHRESGDVYPPGPDASGGRYWIVNQPPVGFPYVPIYKTDTYVVEFLQKFCPEESSQVSGLPLKRDL